MEWTTRNDCSILIWMGRFKSESSLKEFFTAEFPISIDLPDCAISQRRRYSFFSNDMETLLSKLPYFESYENSLRRVAKRHPNFNGFIVLSEHQPSIWPPPDIQAAKFVGRFELDLSTAKPKYLDSNVFCIWVGEFPSKRVFDQYFSIRNISRLTSSRFARDFGVVAIDYELATFDTTVRMKPVMVDALIANFEFSKKKVARIASAAKRQNISMVNCIFIVSGLNYDLVDCKTRKLAISNPPIKYIGTFRWDD